MRFRRLPSAELPIDVHPATLALRVYAMYGNTRTLLVLCSGLLINEVIVVAIIWGYPHGGLKVPGKRLGGHCRHVLSVTEIFLLASQLSTPAPGVHICVESDPRGKHWISYYWTAILVVESTLLSLSLYKGWQNFRSKYTTRALRLMTRDSILFFFAYVPQYIYSHLQCSDNPQHLLGLLAESDLVAGEHREFTQNSGADITQKFIRLPLMRSRRPWPCASQRSSRIA